MALPETLSNHRSGRTRERKTNTKKKSYRVFKNWTYTADGTRAAPKAVSHKFARYNADLCSTYYVNPAEETQTVHGLGFDIDLKRTSFKWHDEKGRVSWTKIGAFLAENEAPILRFITSVAASTSGKGLGLYLPIAPLEVVASTAKAQQSARVLQAHIITILNYHGIGADPGAMGLCRDIPNYLNPKKLIDSDLLGTDRLVDNKRYPVVAELLKYTNQHRAVKRLKSEDPKRLFSGHRTSEKKLASFYEYLLDEALDGSIWLSGAEISELTRLSKATLYNFLSSEHEWLEIINHGKSEGYELVFNPTGAHSERCYELLNGIDLDSVERGLWSGFSDLEAPELVFDGDRNDYLTRAAIELKHKAIPYTDALAIMERIARRIPGASRSRNCRNVSAIVESIYHHRLELFGIKAQEPLSLVLWTELGKIPQPREVEFPKKSKKGNTVGILPVDHSFVVGAGEVSFFAEGLAQFDEKKPPESSQGVWGSSPVQDVRGHQDTSLKIGRTLEIPASQGAQVILFPSKSVKPEFDPVLALLEAYVRQAARTIQAGKFGPQASQARSEEKPAFLSLEQASANECARIDAVLAAKAGKLEPAEKTESRRYQTLREKRRAEFLDRDPLDRFFACCVRSRIPKADILEALEAAEPKIVDARRRGLKLTRTDKLKRVLQAFELMSDHMRSLAYFDLASMEDWK